MGVKNSGVKKSGAEKRNGDSKESGGKNNVVIKHLITMFVYPNQNAFEKKQLTYFPSQKKH